MDNTQLDNNNNSSNNSLTTANQEKEEELEEDDKIPDWLYDDNDPRSYYMQVNELKYTDVVTVKRVYSLARKLAKLFSNIGLFYWTTGGTTLGIVRHGGLIPWDDDLDVCVLQQDIPTLLSATEQFHDLGLHIQSSQPYALKIFDLVESEPVENCMYTHRYPFCDVFVMQKLKKDGKHCYMLCDKTGRNAWPHEVYSQHQLDSVTARNFGNCVLQCPGNPEEYLNNTYGTNWAQVGATHFFNHQNAGFMRSTQFHLEMDMFQPALPFD